MTAKISAGTLTNEVLDAAAEAKVHIMTGVCNTVGIIPALLGGGMGMQASLYGMGVDNILSARLATADGKVVTVSAEENKELFWGLRGAGHNFGIVSELTVKAHPQINEGMHWTYMLMFPGTEDIVKKVAEAVMEMGIGKGMGLGMVFARVPPAFQVSLSLIPPHSRKLILTDHSPQLFSTCGTPAPKPRAKINSSLSSLSRPQWKWAAQHHTA